MQIVGRLGDLPGVVDLGDGWVAALAIESGADVTAGPGRTDAVVRARGARPVAALDALHLGPLTERGTALGARWAIAGLSAGARAAGVPIVGGEVVVDPVYRGTPLVTVLTAGVARADEVDAHAAPTAPPAEPLPHLPSARPAWIDGVNARKAEDLPRAASGDELARQLLDLVGSPTLASRDAATDQFDRYAGGDTVLAQPEGAGVVRIDAGTGRGIALALTSQPRACLLNPYLGAQLALGEAYRGVVATGAAPRAVAVGLAVGSAEDPAVVWQADESVLGLVDGCAALGVPVVAADLAFRGAVDGANIHPTPVVGVVGVLDDVASRTPMGVAHPGDAVVLLGHTRADLSGSAWADVVHGHLGGMPPMPNLAAGKGLGRVLVAASRQGLLSSAHSLAGGGLALGLVRAALRHDLGVALTLPDGDATVHLFSESAPRAIVSVPAQHYGELLSLCSAAGVPVHRLGEVVEEPVVEVLGQFTLPLAEIRSRWEAPLQGLGARA